MYERFFDRCRRLIDRAGENLTFLGLLRDRQRLADFYAMCDVFVLPSRSDCFPAVQIEAMLAGRLLSPATFPGREGGRPDGMGRLAAPRDDGALAAEVVEVLRDPKRFTKTREDIRAIFDPERSIGEYEALLGDLASR